MAINADTTHLWKADVAQSIDFYNDWFLRFAPGTCRKQRVNRTNDPLISYLEKKQLAALKRWLLRHGYKQIASDDFSNFDAMSPGTFTFSPTLFLEKKKALVNVPFDCVVKPFRASELNLPIIIIKAKLLENTASAIRKAKKDAQKFSKFNECYAKNSKLILLLCGYLDPYYLGPQAAEGIDWVWQHRLDDLSAFFTGCKKSVLSNKVAEV